MMTVVVQTQKGKILVFTKGADTSVEPLLIGLDKKDRATLENLNDFANEGLRTLVYAYKELKPRSVQQIKNMIPEEFESDLTLLGVTGVEDLL
jgi:magnesium-transporting ATPase (P-type)